MAVIDWGPAVAVAVLGRADLGMDQPWTASTTSRWVVALLLGLPLAWRRRYPLGSLCVFAAVISFQVIVIDPAVNFGSFVALIVSTYAVGRHADLRRAVVGAAVIAAVNVVVILSGRGVSSPAEFLIPIFYLGASWGLGRALQAREHRNDELVELTETLRVERDQRGRLAVAEERARIARELHDVVAHTVSTMVLQAEAADEIFESDPQRARQTLRTIQQGGRQGLVELRRLLGVLREQGAAGLTSPAPQPGIRELDNLAETMRESGMKLELSIEGDLEALPTGLQLTTYRIVQEALTNTLKHAGPVATEVSVALRDQSLDIRVADKGLARTSNGSAPGHGLIGMSERVGMFGGTLETGQGEEGGYVVMASLPLEETRS